MSRDYAHAPLSPEHRPKWRRDAHFFKECRQVLDLGCGPGDFLEALREIKVPGYGVDLEPASLRVCKKRGLSARRDGALTHLKRLKPASVDGIHCSNLLEHLPAGEALALIRLSAQKLKSGGRLSLSTANPACLGLVAGVFWDDSQHVRFYSQRLLAEEAIAAGLNVLFVGGDELTRPQSLVRSLLRWFRTRLVGPYFEASELLLQAKKI